MDGWIDWLDAWMHGWMDGGMDGWMNRKHRFMWWHGLSGGNINRQSVVTSVKKRNPLNSFCGLTVND